MKRLRKYLLKRYLKRFNYLDRCINASSIIVENVLLIKMYSHTADVRKYKSVIMSETMHLLKKFKFGTISDLEEIISEYLIESIYDDLDAEHMTEIIRILNHINYQYNMTKTPEELWTCIENDIKYAIARIVNSLALSDGLKLFQSIKTI